jgi:hypothetical protein
MAELMRTLALLGRARLLSVTYARLPEAHEAPDATVEPKFDTTPAPVSTYGDGDA